MVAVVFTRGARWADGVPLAAQSSFAGHVAHVTELRYAGVMIEVGAFADPEMETSDDLLGLALLDEKGWELCDVLLAITAWGDRWTAGEAGPPVLIRHHQCGKLTHAELRCAECGKPLHAQEVTVEPGPGQGAAVHHPDAEEEP